MVLLLRRGRRGRGKRRLRRLQRLRRMRRVRGFDFAATGVRTAQWPGPATPTGICRPPACWRSHTRVLTVTLWLAAAGGPRRVLCFVASFCRFCCASQIPQSKRLQALALGPSLPSAAPGVSGVATLCKGFSMESAGVTEGRVCERALVRIS
jgi:hypothetical protein